MRLAALAVTVLAVTAASAPARDAPAYEATARCAAFWLARRDFARSYTVTDAPGRWAIKLAESFRAAAHRLATGAPATVDRYIADEREDLFLLTEAYILGRDEQSRDVFRFLARRCAALAAERPETRDIERPGSDGRAGTELRSRTSLGPSSIVMPSLRNR